MTSHGRGADCELRSLRSSGQLRSTRPDQRTKTTTTTHTRELSDQTCVMGCVPKPWDGHRFLTRPRVGLAYARNDGYLIIASAVSPRRGRSWPRKSARRRSHVSPWAPATEGPATCALAAGDLGTWSSRGTAIARPAVSVRARASPPPPRRSTETGSSAIVVRDRAAGQKQSTTNSPAATRPTIERRQTFGRGFHDGEELVANETAAKAADQPRAARSRGRLESRRQ